MHIGKLGTYLALLSCAILGNLSFAQDFPNKPIRMVVGFHLAVESINWPECWQRECLAS